MSLEKQIDQDTIAAMKAGEKDKVTVLRGLKSEIKNRRIDKHDDLTDEEVIEVLSSAAKKRRESIEQFEKGGRDDLVQNEQFGLAIIEAYLPEQMGEDEIRAIVKDAIEKTGADSPAKLGLVMKEVMPQVKGKADGKLVNKLAAQMLS